MAANRRGRPKGSKNKTYKHSKGYLPYGSGCKRHSDCFTCPLPDCKWDASREG